MLEGENLYIKLIDFGEAKIVDTFDCYGDTSSKNETNRSSGEDETRSDGASFFSKMLGFNSEAKAVRQKRGGGTFVGTAMYQPPEMLRDNQSGLYTDLWALGCVVFELVSHGKKLFAGRTIQTVHNEILQHEFEAPADLDVDAADLVRQLTNPVKCNRLGLKNIEALKQHKFFHGINFNALAARRLEAPAFDLPIDSPVNTGGSDQKRIEIPATPTFLGAGSSGEVIPGEASQPIDGMTDPRQAAIRREQEATVIKAGQLARRSGLIFYSYRAYTVYLLDNGQL